MEDHIDSRWDPPNADDLYCERWIEFHQGFVDEIVGPYKLIKIAGEGPNASSSYWKALCLKCGEIVTVNVSRMDNLRTLKGCNICKGKPICHTCPHQLQTG
jgi:hypothetical protein